MWDLIEAKNQERERERERTIQGLRSERGKVGREGSVAAGLVQIGDGFVEEERRVCGGRKKRWRGSEERDTGK